MNETCVRSRGLSINLLSFTSEKHLASLTRSLLQDLWCGITASCSNRTVVRQVVYYNGVILTSKQYVLSSRGIVHA